MSLITAWWIPEKPLRRGGTACKYMEWSRSINGCGLDWIIWQEQLSFTTASGRTSRKQSFWNWMKWSGRVCFILHTHQAVGPPATIFTVISPTSFFINASRTKTMTRTPLCPLQPPERRISASAEHIHYFSLGELFHLEWHLSYLIFIFYPWLCLLNVSN